MLKLPQKIKECFDKKLQLHFEQIKDEGILMFRSSVLKIPTFAEGTPSTVQATPKNPNFGLVGQIINKRTLPKKDEPVYKLKRGSPIKV